MNTKVLLALGLTASVLYSCKKNDKETTPVDQGKPLSAFSHLPKYPNKVIYLTSGSDFLKDLKNADKESASIIGSETLPGGTRWIVETREQVVLPDFEEIIYPGSIIKGSSVPGGTFDPVVGYDRKPITVGLSLVGKNVTGTIAWPAWTSTIDFVNNALLSGVSGKQLASFSFDMQQITNYNEMKLTFGANVSVGSVFSVGINGTSMKIKKKFGLTAKFIQKNFTLNMDIPRDGQLINGTIDPALIGQWSPVYVNSITYGRMGVVLIESDDNYEELSLAFKAAFNIGVVKGDVGVTLDQKAIINRASIKIFLVGGQGETGVKTINGYDEFKEHILKGGEFSANDPGVPLFFRLRYLSDHTLYKTNFNVDVVN
ncbi:thiol-activated cytolysin family protein [Chitinophaga pendula]|uniref:thiol-activated cytolysin family protein n=1 Tax=Chitinophaga TaxID=79328 RepID=UPI000BB08AAF|nr:MULTISPECIES: thiol-activated cytolysin family protein [Chitinophaga]ASZ09800.1 hypothetical protein CK934_01800 [Chitinophaga sp. MD30]UCJ07260.1 thiol-activated cytolysin family protein [Chitinophaga pendula]